MITRDERKTSVKEIIKLAIPNFIAIISMAITMSFQAGQVVKDVADLKKEMTQFREVQVKRIDKLEYYNEQNYTKQKELVGDIKNLTGAVDVQKEEINLVKQRVTSLERHKK